RGAGHGARGGRVVAARGRWAPGLAVTDSSVANRRRSSRKGGADTARAQPSRPGGVRRFVRFASGPAAVVAAAPLEQEAQAAPRSRKKRRRQRGKHRGESRPSALAAAALCRSAVLSPAQRAARPGMGSAAPSRASRAEPSLAALRQLLAALGLLLLGAGDCQLHISCGIHKCTTDFVSFTSHLNVALEGFDLEFCKALRAYSVCTYCNSKVCHGNLVYHSAVLGIGDLMTQRNCTKDGPTSSANPEMTHDPCNYSDHTAVREHHGGEKTSLPTYLFCGLFGDPHLRTFKDHFQTCKVEGAWPLIDNNYLSVQVTNVPVVSGFSATATNKITIVFKSYQDCTDQKVY
ncbi:hypothetical protein Nmel_007781, partial [Mimus melanotis]